MRKFILIAAFCLIFGSLLSSTVQAQLQPGAFEKYTKGETGVFEKVYKTDADLESSLPAAIGNVISIALSFIGVILLVILVYAGFLWLTAGGNEEQVGRAKKYIKNGVIGLVIALSAYLITSFVVRKVQESVGMGGQTQQTSGNTNPAAKAGTGTGGGTTTPPSDKTFY